MMHTISDRLKNSGKVGTLGGPLWFIQIWILAHFGDRLSPLNLATAGPMSNPLNESGPSIQHRSLGEKLLRIASSVSRLEPREFVSFLEMFLIHDSPPSIQYCESSPFIWPSFLDLSQPLSDSSRSLLRFCISPAVLSIGFSKKGKQANPSFELYHPAVFARQSRSWSSRSD